MNQQLYMPQQQPYQNFQRPQPQQMDLMQPQYDRYQQQQPYNNPAPMQNEQIASNNERHLPRQSSLRGERQAQGNQLQRSGTMEYGNVDVGSSENIDGGNYGRGNTMETNESKLVIEKEKD